MDDVLPIAGASQTAFIVMAVAMSIQTIAIVGALIGMTMAWKRMQVVFDARYRELADQLDEAVQPIKQAAHAVEHASTQASGALDRAGQAASVATSLVMGPRHLLLVGAASVARAVLKRWPRKPTSPTIDGNSKRRAHASE